MAMKNHVAALHSELTTADRLLEEIISTLKACDGTKNLSNVIGAFARTMPEFNFLEEERGMLLTIVRKICTCEISCGRAAELLETARNDVQDELGCIKL